MRRALPLFALPALVVLAGCTPKAAPCTGAETLERSLAGLGARAWESLPEREVLAAWPAPLAREDAALAFGSDGSLLPYELQLRKEREDRRGCVCCQALEFGQGTVDGLALRVVSLHVPAPTWAEASRVASRLVLAGIPPHVAARLTIPPTAPPDSALPWTTSAAWASEPDPEGRVMTGTALVEIDSAPGGFVVLVRHQRPAPAVR